MDRRYFIHPRSVVGTSVEGKVIALLNSFNTPQDFDVIQDRPGFGYAVTHPGYGIDHPTAQRILDARPSGGWTGLSQIVGDVVPFDSNIAGFGQDKFSDLVVSAIALSGGTDHRTIRGSFRLIDPDAASLTPPNITDPIDVIVYGKFSGASTDYVVPVQMVQTDANGEFILEHITNDFEQFALVAAFSDSEEVFHRSGLIPIQTYTLPELEYRPILVNQSFALEDSDFRDRVEEQAGTVVEGDKTLESITSDFKDGFVEIQGEILAPDTFLWFDSTITFTSEVRYLPSQYAPNWVRDLSEIMGVQSQVTDQNHSNAGFIIASVLAFFIPGVGLALGPIVTIIFLAIDANQDSNIDTKTSIANALRDAFSDQTLATFQAAIQDQIDNADALTQFGLEFLSDFEEDPEDPLQAIIDYMASHATVQTVSIDPDEMELNIWLTLPFTI
ncbi:MAG: hypothetical protein GY938_27500 [Ketobacter sp.]|nr:hypothetical protein [Ketobacter sp.]